MQIVQKAADLQEAISEGATSFLLTEYKYMGIFMVRRYWEIQMIGRGQSRLEFVWLPCCSVSQHVCKACHYVHGVYDAMSLLWASFVRLAIFRGAQGRGCGQRDRENIYFYPLMERSGHTP